MSGLLGLVLCGGESRRMGRDKGLMMKGGLCWANYMAEKLERYEVPVVYSVNAGQRAAYAAALGDLRLVTDSPALGSVEGPLRGLLTVHERFPDKDLLLVACDMLDLDAGTVGRLIEVYEDEVSGMRGNEEGAVHDFFVYDEAGFLQPFCGIYTSAGLARPHRAVLEGVLIDYSLQSMLRKGRTARLEIARPEAFSNYNTI